MNKINILVYKIIASCFVFSSMALIAEEPAASRNDRIERFRAQFNARRLDWMPQLPDTIDESSISQWYGDCTSKGLPIVEERERGILVTLGKNEEEIENRLFDVYNQTRLRCGNEHKEAMQIIKAEDVKPISPSTDVKPISPSTDVKPISPSTRLEQVWDVLNANRFDWMPPLPPKIREVNGAVEEANFRSLWEEWNRRCQRYATSENGKKACFEIYAQMIEALTGKRPLPPVTPVDPVVPVNPVNPVNPDFPVTPVQPVTGWDRIISLHKNWMPPLPSKPTNIDRHSLPLIKKEWSAWTLRCMQKAYQGQANECAHLLHEVGAYLDDKVKDLPEIPMIPVEPKPDLTPQPLPIVPEPKPIPESPAWLPRAVTPDDSFSLRDLRRMRDNCLREVRGDPFKANQCRDWFESARITLGL